MTRKIYYITKSTSAKTIYIEISAEDMHWIKDQCKEIIKMNNFCKINNISSGLILDNKNSLLPKLSTGRRNSPVTLCQGILQNFTTGQYNLTKKQMQGLLVVFKIANQLADAFEDMTLHETVSLNRAPVEVQGVQTTFLDLFEVKRL